MYFTLYSYGPKNIFINAYYINANNENIIMRTITLNDYVLKVYDDIEELPIVNFQKYNKYMLIDAGIGSDIDSVDSHLVRIAKYVNTDKAKAMQELQNMRQCLYMIVSNISPIHLAFAALIYSINGAKVTDLSDENLKNILDKLKHTKRSKLIDFIADFKKKLKRP